MASRKVQLIRNRKKTEKPKPITLFILITLLIITAAGVKDYVKYGELRLPSFLLQNSSSYNGPKATIQYDIDKDFGSFMVYVRGGDEVMPFIINGLETEDSYKVSLRLTNETTVPLLNLQSNYVVHDENGKPYYTGTKLIGDLQLNETREDTIEIKRTKSVKLAKIVIQIGKK